MANMCVIFYTYNELSSPQGTDCIVFKRHTRRKEHVFGKECPALYCKMRKKKHTKLALAVYFSPQCRKADYPIHTEYLTFPHPMSFSDIQMPFHSWASSFKQSNQPTKCRTQLTKTNIFFGKMNIAFILARNL